MAPQEWILPGSPGHSSGGSVKAPHTRSLSSEAGPSSAFASPRARDLWARAESAQQGPGGGIPHQAAPLAPGPGSADATGAICHPKPWVPLPPRLGQGRDCLPELHGQTELGSDRHLEGALKSAWGVPPHHAGPRLGRVAPTGMCPSTRE